MALFIMAQSSWLVQRCPNSHPSRYMVDVGFVPVLMCCLKKLSLTEARPVAIVLLTKNPMGPVAVPTVVPVDKHRTGVRWVVVSHRTRGLKKWKSNRRGAEVVGGDRGPCGFRPSRVPAVPAGSGCPSKCFDRRKAFGVMARTTSTINHPVLILVISTAALDMSSTGKVSS